VKFLATAVGAGRLIIDPRLVILPARLKARVSITKHRPSAKIKTTIKIVVPWSVSTQTRGEAHETS
jgi:hypothetical protein